MRNGIIFNAHDRMAAALKPIIIIEIIEEKYGREKDAQNGTK